VPLPAVGDRCEVLIEYPRWSMIKRRSDGAVDFVSPLPCPYNYGHVPGTMSEDGDQLDAVVLGRRLRAGEQIAATVVGVIGFYDVGLFDPKLIVSARPLTALQRRGLEAFFTVYALGKRALAAARGKTGATRYVGWLAR
jgi:inorganic pyrophosphatase